MPSEKSLRLEQLMADLVRVLEVVEEIRQVDGKASYESAQQETAGELELHLLSYIRFLESSSLLTYDRITDELVVTTQGEAIRDNPEDIRDTAAEAFADQLASIPPAATTDPERVAPGDISASMEPVAADEPLSDVFDDVAGDMDAALEGLERSSTKPLDSLGDGFEAPSGPAAGVAVGDGGGVSFGGAATTEKRASTVRMNEGSLASDEPATSLPTEENSMNGETDAPATNASWAQSSSHGGADDAYERFEQLGSGGLGTVYTGRQIRLNRPVAIKEIREIFKVFAGINRNDIIERFQGIVEAQAALVHSNVIQLIDADTSGEYPFLVMQLAPNGNLRRLLEHGERPPLKVSLKYFLQMLHALNAAHDQGIIHGSLKPENVVLDHAGNSLMTDFGISQIVERDSGGGNQVYVGVGSVAYMSPEQFQDPNLATVQSDIYSLGIMFYEMLTGKVPGRRSPMPSSFYPDIPRALDDIFDRMSMDREEDRYDSVEQIIADLYRSEDVMALLDKQSGVLFLRDPITHGESGLAEEIDLDSDVVAPPSVAASGFDDDAQAEVPEVLEEEPTQAGEDGSGTDEEPVEIDSDGGGDVLDKLDKYGEMFEED